MDRPDPAMDSSGSTGQHSDFKEGLNSQLLPHPQDLAAPSLSCDRELQFYWDGWLSELPGDSCKKYDLKKRRVEESQLLEGSTR